MHTCCCLGECTDTEDSRIAWQCLIRTTTSVAAQTLPTWQPTNHIQFFTMCKENEGEKARIHITNEKGTSHYQRQRKWKMHEPARGVPCYVKLQCNGTVGQSLLSSSMENLKSCNKGILIDFCNMCFPQCWRKCGKAHFRDRMITSTFRNCQEKISFNDDLF